MCIAERGGRGEVRAQGGEGLGASNQIMTQEAPPSQPVYNLFITTYCLAVANFVLFLSPWDYFLDSLSAIELLRLTSLNIIFQQE